MDFIKSIYATSPLCSNRTPLVISHLLSFQLVRREYHLLFYFPQYNGSESAVNISLISFLQALAMLAAPLNSQWSANRILLKADFGNANNRSPHLRQTRRWSIL